MADDGHKIAVTARLRPQNAEAVLRIVEGDPLDEASEHFLRRRLRIRLHTDRRILLFRHDAANVTAPAITRAGSVRRRQSQTPAGWSLAGDESGFPHCGLTGVFRVFVV